jgi:hypothetical protein
MTQTALAAAFSEIAAMDVEPDGVSFDPSSIVVVPIREEDAYGGRRVTLKGWQIFPNFSKCARPPFSRRAIDWKRSRRVSGSISRLPCISRTSITSRACARSIFDRA